MDTSPLGIFGKYFILRRVAVGGMAEIYLARPASASANGRIIILKRILPKIVLDTDLIRMFQSEIKVSMAFNHLNLVRIFDFGRFEGTHYIAMEYIEGKNLREISEKFKAFKKNLPVEFVVNIGVQTALGLQYAHEFKNHVTGESLNVVHRDISPQNILVSYEGHVKIIDFGIAKTGRGKGEKTRTGFVKGKLSYLSPDQLFQKELDGRSDLFSLGTVLWELLTGRKLFPHKNRSDLEIMQSIANCEKTVVAPSQFNSEIPKALDQVILKLLAKNREDRFQSALELRIALEGILQKNYPGFNQQQMSEGLREIFANEVLEERQNIQNLNRIAQDLLESMDQTTQNELAIPEGYGSPFGSSLPDRLFYQPSLYATTSRETEVRDESNPQLAKKVREKFYIKLTLPRAIGLLFYAATLLVLRLDHEQVVLNVLFGQWKSPKVEVKNESSSVSRHEEKKEKIVPLSSEEVSDRSLAQEPVTTVLLQIRLILNSGAPVTAIRVDNQLLDLKNPSVRVPAHQAIWIQVERKDGKKLRKRVEIKPETHDFASSYSLTLNLNE